MAEFPAELHAEIEKYERKHAENPDGRYFLPLANTYRKLGQLERAEGLLREGLRRHPDYLSAHIVLGRTLAERGAAEEATSEFQQVLAVDPQNLIALRTLGELALGEGRLEQAAAWYRELLAVDPMNEEARQALAGIEVKAGEIRTGAAEPPVPDWVESIDPFLGDSEAMEAGGDRLPSLEPVKSSDEESRSGLETGWEEPGGEAGPAESVELEAPEAGAFPDAGLGSDARGGSYEAGWDELLEAEPEDLASETLAELYARQGFLRQAAEMYRQLIRRRGQEPALVLRLAELEAAEAGEIGEAVGEDAGAGAEAADSAEEPFVGLESFETPHALPAEPGLLDLAPPPAEFAGGGEDTATDEQGPFLEAATEPGGADYGAVEIELKPAEAELQPGVEDAATEDWQPEHGAPEPELTLQADDVEAPGTDTQPEPALAEAGATHDGQDQVPTVGAAVDPITLEPTDAAAAFAESFRFGFAGAGAAEAVLAGHLSSPAPRSDAQAAADPADHKPPPEANGERAAPAPTIGEYFRTLLAWEPPRPEHPGGAAVSGEPGRVAPAHGPSWRPAASADPGSAADGDGEAASAERELFPWELPGPPEAAAPPTEERRDEGPPYPADTRDHAGDEPHSDPTEQAPAEPGLQHPGARAEPSPFAEPAAEEDDDLESFQAWLRSLKR
jgi:tetratricopeptide (TPR) repeat protein